MPNTPYKMRQNGAKKHENAQFGKKKTPSHELDDFLEKNSLSPKSNLT